MVVGPGRSSAGPGSLIEPRTERLATFGGSVIVSADHGATWQPIGSPLPYTPTGLVYAPFRKAFYLWRFDGNTGRNTSVRANAIERMDYDYAKP